MRKNFHRTLTALALVSIAAVGLLASAGSTGAAKKPYIIWLEIGAGNPYWDAQHKAAAEAGRRLGFDFKAVSGNSSASDQAAILKQLVDQKPSVIMLNAVDPKAMGPSLAYAKQHGVPVLEIYAVNPAATDSITFDELRSGRVDAEYAATLLKERYGKATGQIAVLHGILGQPQSDLRANGFINYVKKNLPGVKIVAVQGTDWTADKASAAMQDWLVKYPSLSMVYGLSDTISVPAVNVAQRQNRLCTEQNNWTANKNCIVFVSVDGFFLNEVAKGRLFSTELYSPQWTGWKMVQVAYNMALKKKVPKVSYLKSMLVTKQNAACVLKMTNDMINKLTTFPFTAAPTLQGIASNVYHCQVLDANM
ncbi:MAG: sugar ABC transporter substrate-binding protein [Gaiellaceae bacterium]|jgi:ribose transport system substrate-binding protein